MTPTPVPVATAQKICGSQNAGQFNFLKQPIAYLNKKQMRALNNIRRKPAESDETDLAGLLVQNITKTDDGQFVTEGGQEVIPCDCVILAIGQRPAARIQMGSWKFRLRFYDRR